MKRLIIIFIYLKIFFFSHSILAQNLPHPIQSPSVASLNEFVKNGAPQYTGSLSFNIPLFEVKEKSLSLPISLSYSYSGIRPDQEPGWVGSGWSLNAGGVITRMVKEVPDEYIYKYGASNEKRIGYYYNKLVSPSSETNVNYAISDYNKNRGFFTREYEADEFFFTLPGLSGSFYLNSNGKWVVKSDKHVSVLCTNALGSIPNSIMNLSSNKGDKSKQSPTFYSFIVTTDDGVKYYFGGSDNAIEYNCITSN